MYRLFRFSMFSLIFLSISFIQSNGTELSNRQLQKCSPGLKFVLKKQAAALDRYRDTFETSTESGETVYHVIIKFSDSASALDVPGVSISATIGSIATARATQQGIFNLTHESKVEWIDISRIIPPCLDVSRISTEVDQVYDGNPSYRGDGVLVAIFDSGIDWKHEDFIDAMGNSRILYLWDQTDDAGPHPAGYDYGTEYTRAQINNEIDGSPAGLVREKDINGHGSHVAGIAGGDGSATGNGYQAKRYIGMAPQADLIFVKGGDYSFSTYNQINGAAYVRQKADELGRPVVINFSLGGHWGAHDGTELHELAFDEAVGPGKAIVISAGNEGDLPLHASGQVFASETVTTTFTVAENSEDFFINIWHEGSDRMTLTVTAPNGYTTTAFASGSAEDWQSYETDAGKIEIIAPSKSPENQDFCFCIYVSDDAGTAVADGDWSFQLRGNQISDGRFDAWSSSDVEFTSNLDWTMLVSVPGTAREAITVASYCTKREWDASDGGHYFYTSNPALWDISSFSSPGPTRDGRAKPELTAPGHGITSVLSADSEPSETRIVEDGVHTLMQGTSMASPHVAGAIALLFQKNPRLTPDQLKDILTSSATIDDYTGAVWNRYWGHGKLDISAALDLVEGSLAGSAFQQESGKVNCGLSDWGGVGNASGGDPGFTFPKSAGTDHGYSGTFIAGVWGEDMADSYGNLNHCEDDTWRTTATGKSRVIESSMVADTETFAQFEKYLTSPNGLAHLTVNQHSYSWNAAPYDQFILLDYEIMNDGDATLTNLLLGFLMDWDCQPNYETNDATYASDLRLGYMWDSGATGNDYLGVALLNATPYSFKIINNANTVYETSDLLDQIMFELMNASGAMGSIGQGDLSILLTAPKISLSPGKSARFTIALAAGYDLSDLRQSASRAAEKYAVINNHRATELFYDDGTHEGGVYVTGAGERLAVEFTPPTYPAKLSFVNFYIYGDAASLKLNVIDDNGSAGVPGSALLASPVTFTPQGNAWNTVDLSAKNIQINSGNFYISMEWLAGGEPSLGYDEDFPYAGRSWYFDGAAWSNFIDDGDPWDKRDLMIGAGLQMNTPVIEDESEHQPERYTLAQNYPNPFNATTTILFTLPHREFVTLKIYDLLGREIATLARDQFDAGTHRIHLSTVHFNSGLYLYRIQAGAFVETKKMLHVK
ncbi:MAG: S8 family serine peptidase [Candidatus Zhuqueibacterota bacterium]